MKKMKQNRVNNQGFTLVELIIVVAIIAMLIAMIAPNLTSFLDTASDTTLRANAKTAFTSVNAWVTQQRVAGVPVDEVATDNPIVIKKNGDNLEVTTLGGTDYAHQSTYAELAELFNAGEFKNTTSVQIWIASNYKVKSVNWIEGSEQASYPD